MSEFYIVCTDTDARSKQPQHGRTELRTLTWDGGDGALAERLAVTGQHGLGAAEGVSGRTVRRLEPSVTFHGGGEQWGWRCPRCRRDAQISGANLRAWMRNTQTAELDISLLPRG